MFPGGSCRQRESEGEWERGYEADRGTEHQQVPVQPRQRHHGARPEELPCSLPQLQAHPPSPELPGRQQQDPDVRQHLPQGGAYQRNVEFVKVKLFMTLRKCNLKLK